MQVRDPSGGDAIGAAAAARMAAMLPGLLAAVRGRRRQRRAARAARIGACAGAVLAAIALSVRPWLGAVEWPRPAPPAPAQVPVATAVHVAVVRGGPDVSDCLCADVAVPAAWFIGDDELQQRLIASARPAGLVRIGDRVIVASAAIDALPMQP